MMIFKFACEFHEHFFLRDTICKRLNNLLYFIVKLRLRPYIVEPFNKLLHDFSTVFFVLSTQHAHQIHDPLNQATIVEVEILNQSLEDILMRIKQSIAILLKQLGVPLNYSFLSLRRRYCLELLLQPHKDVIKLFP